MQLLSCMFQGERGRRKASGDVGGRRAAAVDSKQRLEPVRATMRIHTAA